MIEDYVYFQIKIKITSTYLKLKVGCSGLNIPLMS